MSDQDLGLPHPGGACGAVPDSATGARAVPIYQSTSFVFEDTTDAASLFALQKYGLIYSRIANPTVATLEERLASLDGGIGAVATSSGQAAEFLTFACLAGAGDHIVAAAGLYGGTITQLDVTLRRFGVDTTFVPGEATRRVRSGDHAEHQAAVLRGRGEPGRGDRRHRRAGRGRPLRGDPTGRRRHNRHPVPVPPDRARRRHRDPLGHEVPRRARHNAGRRGDRVGPLQLGQRQVPADDGTGAVLRRAHLVGELPRVRVPHQTARGAAARRRRLVVGTQRVPADPGGGDAAATHGGAPRNARVVAEWLDADPRVSYVRWAGLPGHPHHDRAARYLPLGPGAVFSFGVQGGRQAGRRFIE